jgi:phospholipid/cholesterol/gamma-HCH transport system ATP-binding protein
MTGDKVAMLSEGKFIKMGTFDEVFESDDERIKDFYEYNFIN